MKHQDQHFTFGGKYTDERHPTIPEVDGVRHLTVKGLNSLQARKVVEALTMVGKTPVFAFQYGDDELPYSQREAGSFMTITVDRSLRKETRGMIGLVIPADESEPIRTELFDPEGIKLRQILGGMVERAYTSRTQFSAIAGGLSFNVYAHESSRILQPPLPYNARANHMLGEWAENYLAKTTITTIDRDDGSEHVRVIEHDDQLTGLILGDAVVLGEHKTTLEDAPLPLSIGYAIQTVLHETIELMGE